MQVRRRYAFRDWKRKSRGESRMWIAWVMQACDCQFASADVCVRPMRMPRTRLALQPVRRSADSLTLCTWWLPRAVAAAPAPAAAISLLDLHSREIWRIIGYMCSLTHWWYWNGSRYLLSVEKPIVQSRVSNRCEFSMRNKINHVNKLKNCNIKDDCKMFTKLCTISRASSK